VDEAEAEELHAEAAEDEVRKLPTEDADRAAEEPGETTAEVAAAGALSRRIPRI
jgi:hypothetical protein